MAPEPQKTDPNPQLKRTKIKKEPAMMANSLILLAERTGLEPATSGVTGRHSNQLNYRSNGVKLWWAEQGLNL